MTHDLNVYILVASTVTLAIKILPLTLIRGEIKNRTVRSFLHYVPYVTLGGQSHNRFDNFNRGRGGNSLPRQGGRQ